MKEFGVKLKDQEIGNMFSTSENKIKAQTQDFILMNYDKDDYKPFLRKDGIYLPINYTRIICINNNKEIISTNFIEGKEKFTNIYKDDSFKTISFLIEEL